MAEAAAEPKASESSASVVDNELSLAEGLQKTAIWIAGALGAIPVFATIGALIEKSGDEGFDYDRLGTGLALAVLGALIGLAGSAYMRAPFGTRLADIVDDDIARVPGSAYSTKDELVSATDQARQAIADLEEPAAIAAVEAKRKSAVASRLAKELEGMRGQTPNATIVSINEASTLHANAAMDAEGAEQKAGIFKADVDRWKTQLERRKGMLDQAFRVHNASEAKSRMFVSALTWVAATAAIGASLFYLATAPIKKAETTASVAPELVVVTLNPTGRARLECDVDALQGLKVGGTDQAPEIITLPTPDCPSRSVTFPAAEPTAWGTVEKVKTIDTQG